MKNLSLLLMFALLASSCAMFGPKPQVMYHRADIKTVTNKLIIFPTTDFTGKVSEGANSINNSIISSWANLGGKDAYLNIIKALDNTSMVEQLHKNPKIREFVSVLTSKLGNYNFALAIISDGATEFDAKKPV